MDGYSVKELEARHVMQTYSRFDLELVRGKGSMAWDEAGKSYIDLGGGIAVNSFGFSDGEWVEAVTRQLGQIQHTSNLYYTSPGAMLAGELHEKTGYERFFFSNSGAEANECAIKAARKHSLDTHGEGRHTIVTLTGSFHGRTLATLAATGQERYRAGFGPDMPGFVHTPPDDFAAMEAVLNSGGIAAVMMEMIQGEGGVRVLDREFVARTAELAREKGILFIADEVQTGNGRTGAFFASELFGVRPDIVTSAKGLGGGLPIGVTCFSAETAGVLTAGTHGSTFGANPVCCAGALSVVRRIDGDLMAQVRRKGEHMLSRLSAMKGGEGASGMGLMAGVRPTAVTASAAAAELIKRGLLVLTAADRIRLVPALNIPSELLEEGLDILEGYLADA